MPSEKIRPSRLKSSFKLFLFVVWTIFCILLFCVFWLLPFLHHHSILLFYHKNLCRIMGVKVILHGEPCLHKPTLYVSNHVSYLDIPVLGGVIKAYFVAKSEIASWPVINHLCRLQNTIFIERKASKAKQQISILREHLKSNNSLILFPEGTSTNGAEVLPLKSSLFAAVELKKTSLNNSDSNISEDILLPEIMIQPVSIVYSQYKNQGMDQATRDYFAWYADFPFGSHVIQMLGLGNVTAEVSFSRAVKLKDFLSRKECALACETAMRDSFEQVFQDSGSDK